MNVLVIQMKSKSLKGEGSSLLPLHYITFFKFQNKFTLVTQGLTERDET